MTGRHQRCPLCAAGRLMVVEPYEGVSLASCNNRDCLSNRPTGPITPVTDNRARAAAEVESIKRELRDRHDRGEWR